MEHLLVIYWVIGIPICIWRFTKYDIERHGVLTVGDIIMACVASTIPGLREVVFIMITDVFNKVVYKRPT